MCIPVGLEFTIQPVCQGPMAEAELIIPKRRGGRGEKERRTHAISRFAIVGESLLAAGSFHLRRSLFDPRSRTGRLVESILGFRFLAFHAFLVLSQEGRSFLEL